jgi:hypothetical protein
MKSVFLFCFGLLGLSLSAQNLVPNPSFEEVECPENWATPHVFGALGWYNPSASTPDYYGFDAEFGCYTSIYNSSWSDFGEWQFPQDGERMAGMFAYIAQTCVRELLACKLTEPLQAGVSYTASMYVSLSNMSLAYTDGMGMYFSADSLADYTTTCDFNVTPQLANPSGQLLSDSLNWMLVQGEFIAEGGEQYLMIGNVLANDQCIFESYDPDEQFTSAYYFVDNVKVEAHNVVGISEDITSQVVFSPNPVNEFVQFSSNCVGSNYRLIDLTGKLVYYGKLDDQNINLSWLESGIYVINFEEAGLGSIKIVKN